MKTITTTKPTLETCVELIHAAQTVREKARAIACARNHGYKLAELDAALAARRLKSMELGFHINHGRSI